MKIFFLAALLLISACSTKPPVEVVYTSNWREQWQNEILEKCHKESHLLTFQIAEGRIASGMNVDREYVVQLQKFLMDSCVSYYRITI